ncbi:MAG: flagellar basal body rod protein FlgF [Burkholderiales bacterium]|jgi:fagellar hook-basal body proteins|nr:flagellar basal body rod protein FlgF [Burkholderiales bacterium]PZN01851.1 MAG: flagellar biosynthesis protein FlgF [Pseudomonadota bacterium]
MDRIIYTAMTGAKQALARQDTLAHNLANANTVGFRASLTAFRAVPVRGVGEGTRVFSLESTPGVDLSAGPVQQTGRELDVSLSEGGLLAVEGRDGREAYTRAGSLQVDAEGMLRTNTGLLVIGDGGPITIPPESRIAIGDDGTISVSPLTGAQETTTIVGRLKLVKADAADIVKGDDGLLRTLSGEPLPLDETVRVMTGTLEGSNVNVVDAMIGMIAAARQFDMQMRVLQKADEDARTAQQLLNVNG